MTLRWRLLLVTFAIAIPFEVALFLGYALVSRRMNEDQVLALVQGQFVEHPGSSCEELVSAAPRTLNLRARPGGPFLSRAPVQQAAVYVFSSDGNSADADAPAIPTELLSEADSVVGIVSREDAHGRVNYLVPLTRNGEPCAMALVIAPKRGRPAPPLPMVLMPLVVAVLSIVVGLGPVVQRTRALTQAVRRWRADASNTPHRERELDELGELSRAFCDAAVAARTHQEALAARERNLREFVENVSHDLATPLTVLQGCLSSLGDANDPLVRKQAMNEADYMGALLASLAVTAKLETGGRIDSTFDLRLVVARVVDRHRSLSARLEVGLESATPEEAMLVCADSTLTEQALSNLVANAVRYNDAGGHVAVVLEILGANFHVRVTDDGPGLTAEEMTRVLLRGQRGNLARSREGGGQGFGLSIVARVCELHGWRFSLAHGETGGLVAEITGAMTPVEPGG